MPTFASEVGRLKDELAAHGERAEAYERWRAMMKSRGADVDEEAWKRSRECGCLACPTCRPDLDVIARLLDAPFLNVLILCKTAEAEVVDRALALVRPASDRASRRRVDRARKDAPAGAEEHRGRYTPPVPKKRTLEDIRREANDPEAALRADTSATVQQPASTLSTST